MSEVKLYLRNKTRAELEFSIGEDIEDREDLKVKVPAYTSTIISANKGVTLFVSSEGLVGDMWIYEINEDISLDCSLIGEELQLRIGSSI